MDLYLKEDIFVTNFANDLPKHRPATLGLAAGRLDGGVRHTIAGGSMDNDSVVM